MKTILTNCTVIDCTGKPPMKDTTIVIEDNKIANLKPGVYQPVEGEGENRVFDLEGDYVLPGLWSTHAHLGNLSPDPRHLRATESVIECAIRGGRNAMDALRAGITGIRVVGEMCVGCSARISPLQAGMTGTRVVEGGDFVDIAWKRAFDDGVFVGPRLFVCGKPICVTGGYGREGGIQADGPYEVRKAVRENLKHGADQIKLMVRMGAGLLLDEVKAATEVAHQRGKRVCVHAGAVPEEIKMAIRGGADSIEHGAYMDDEAIEMMLENDVFYVPTICITQDQELMRESGMDADDDSLAKAARDEFLRESGMAEFQNVDLGDVHRALKVRARVAKSEWATPERVKAHLESFQKALKAGVKIACGGDECPIKEFTLAEIEHLVRAGMTEMEALIAATRTSADLCGVADRLGTVEAGKLADLIVVAGDPLENIYNIRQLKLVLKGGKLVDTSSQEGLADFWQLFF
jgi:imidazolonepropionase-like amidohydrolase